MPEFVILNHYNNKKDWGIITLTFTIKKKCNDLKSIIIIISSSSTFLFSLFCHKQPGHTTFFFFTCNQRPRCVK